MAVSLAPDRPAEHAQRWEVLIRGTLFAVLPEREQRLVRAIHDRYRLTVQEVRLLCEAARDLQMWGEPRLDAWWRAAEGRLAATAGATPARLERSAARARKQRLMKALREHLDGLRRAATRYGEQPPPAPERPPLHVVSESTGDAVFGDCPVRSERTLCCNLKTIDAVKNCAFGCSYCTIQTFYGDRVAIDADLGAKLRNLDLEPGRFYHIGSGQSSDSLVWGNRGGMLDRMCDFARAHPDVLLEFKTKSANVTYFMDPQRATPANVVCSWSLNTTPVIEHEEHLTATLEQRLRAARRVADRGIRVAFHFHPMVRYAGWEHDYPALARRLTAEFSPDEVSFVSFGSVTFIKPVIREIRRRGEPTRILQTDLVKDPHGKLTYPDDLKVRMFSTMYRALAPWRERVFMYLCMEKPAIWDRAFGWRFSSNEEFEQAFAAGTLYRKSA